jgi:hypothetical protein
MVNSSNDKELDVSSVHIVHESVHFVHHPQTAVDALRKRLVPRTKQVEIHFVLRNQGQLEKIETAALDAGAKARE